MFLAGIGSELELKQKLIMLERENALLKGDSGEKGNSGKIVEVSCFRFPELCR